MTKTYFNLSNKFWITFIKLSKRNVYINSKIYLATTIIPHKLTVQIIYFTIKLRVRYSMAQTSSSDKTSFNTEKEDIFLVFVLENRKIAQEAKSDVPDSNCKFFQIIKFNDTIPHIISQKLLI